MSSRRALRAPSALLARPALLALTAALALTGCSGGLGQPATGGDRKGYIAGDGSVTELAPDQRPEPVQVTGETTDGSTVDVAALRGDVVVLNFWYAGCSPCRAEAGDLAAAAAEHADAGVRFVGVNTRDQAPTAAAFERTHAVPYPSVLDAGSGEAVLALAGQVNPQSIPATIVLDREGRPAARILGRVDPGILGTLIDTAVAEDVA